MALSCTLLYKLFKGYILAKMGWHSLYITESDIFENLLVSKCENS